MQIAKVVGYQGDGVKQHPIIHFYGEDSYIKGKQFPEQCKGNHPYEVLLTLGFEPISSSIWVKRNNLKDD